jgi:hypothetical protein
MIIGTEWVLGILGTISTGGLTWGAIKFRRYLELPARTDRIEENVTYIRGRVDSIYDALISR